MIAGGLEPPTPILKGWYSSLLSYATLSIKGMSYPFLDLAFISILCNFKQSYIRLNLAFFTLAIKLSVVVSTGKQITFFFLLMASITRRLNRSTLVRFSLPNIILASEAVIIFMFVFLIGEDGIPTNYYPGKLTAYFKFGT